VLLPLLPMTLLALQHPLLATWLPLLASFSMFPLLERDGAMLAYIGTNLLYLAITQLLLPHIQAAAGQQQQAAAGGKSKRLSQLVIAALALAALGLHTAKAAVPAPARYPWLWDRGFISLAAAVFAPVALYLNVQQWRLPLEPLQQKQKQS
jgi:alpha-1,3-glucosyltransferase